METPVFPPEIIQCIVDASVEEVGLRGSVRLRGVSSEYMLLVNPRRTSRTKQNSRNIQRCSFPSLREALRFRGQYSVDLLGLQGPP